MNRLANAAAGVALVLVMAAAMLAFVGLIAIAAANQATPVVDAERVTHPVVVRTTALMDRYDCADGLPGGVIPAHTLIRTPAGHLRVASFDRGWAIYQGTAPGTLIAVCAS